MCYKIHGRQHRESTETTNKKLAAMIYEKRRTEVAEGTWFPNEAKKKTFDELRERYMEEHSKPNKAPNNPREGHERLQAIWQASSRSLPYSRSPRRAYRSTNPYGYARA